MIRLVVHLKLDGDEANAQNVVDEILEAGIFQDSINNHDVIDAGAVRVKVAVVRQSPRYRVRYFNRVRSHRGKGVQVRTFDDLEDACDFAAENVLYAKPCVVEVE